MYRRDWILGGMKGENGKDNTGMGRTLGRGRVHVKSRMGCWLGGHMGYFDIILADGVKLC